MPQPMSGLTVDLPSNNSDFARRASSFSSPVNLQGIDLSSLDVRDVHVGGLASSTPLPSSPDERERLATKSFFGNHSASPSAGRAPEETSASASAAFIDGSIESASQSTSTLWHHGHSKTTAASSPTQSDSAECRRSEDADSLSQGAIAIPNSKDNNPLPSPIDTAIPLSQSAPGKGFAPVEARKANKKRLQMLSRSKSLRAEDELNKFKKSGAKKANGHQSQLSTTLSELSLSRNAHSKMKSSTRDRSEDRTVEFDEEKSNKSKQKKEKKEGKEKHTHPKQGHPLSSSLRQHNTSTFFNDFRNSSSNAAIGLGKAGKGLFSKFSRSGSSSDKHAPPAGDHVPGVLTLPLIQQTRITRIAKSYDQCKDKTEFWMPALPWRCIDYLNGKCEEEGLYRVSGGLIQIKEWRKRFDTELDVNLLDESELYDASIIASLFKEWIRELPEDIFPKDAQERITSQLPRELPGRGSVTQMLRDELQQLPPFNYYLLFAITCHLSLLLSYESKNKMTLDNLYRCFNQSLKLDGRIFYTLVGEWRQCWAGCLTENEFLKAEYDHLRYPYPQFIRENSDYLATHSDERAISSSGSSAPPATGVFTPELQRPATSHTQPSHSAEEGDFWLTPVRKSKRSSSDVTGMSPMMKATHTPH